MKELKNIIEYKYHFIIEKIEKNSDSTEGNVYIIYTNNEKYVAKIYKDVNRANNMVNLHQFLENKGLNIPRIINTYENEKIIKSYNGNYIVVYSFLSGKKIGWEQKYCKLNENIVKDIALALKEIHTQTSEKNKFNLPEVQFTSENNGLNKSVLHFDLTRGNIFIYNDKIGIIDFDDAKYGYSLYDVAIAIANLFFSKTYGADMEGVNKFIDEYYKNNLKRKEQEVPLLKEYAIKWIDYILNGNEFDTSTTESFEIRKKLIENNLYKEM